MYDITNLLIRLKNNLNAKSIILLIHNGLGVLNEIKKHLPQLRVISGVSTVGAYLEKAFTVRAFLNGKFYLGQGIGKFTPNETKTICAAFAAAALPYQWLDNIQPILWEKFAINCSINLLTALLGCKNGALLSHQKILKQLTSEAAQVLCAYGVNMSADDLFCKVIDVIEGTADNYSSMYKDVENNKQTEIYYLNERLMTLAHQKELVTPTHSELLNKFYRTFPKQTFGG
ncbi:2-dehydropantoate 2-reductase [Legionella oakridgensis ATCC 33761 = DSM 21215]|uniref:2-dehydropantoate 2-reductase n=1 Tax=Legionella oakridgensis ATCC 33761 = DSM 21215 TaxID=1268635 RepID=W0BH90_9GAMM|nr:2-dehydropantoate 2-reductase [Legionella oakridgensis ATCC 33761 = DSM 21215]